MTANVDENLSSCECQLSSIIQGTSKGIESRRSETSRGRRSQRIEGRKNIKQKKSEESSKVFSAMEGVYNKA